jgi:uncharacterized membrane protein (DUF2068 family)
MTTESSATKKSRGLMVIAALKLVKGMALLALGFGALHFLHRDVAKEIADWIELLRTDPHSRYLIWVLQKFSKVDEHKLRALSVGTFFYAALFLVEGTGLALGKRWAEYLTIVSTASLMPVELYEIYVHTTWERVLVLLVNIAVVAYLVRELRRSRKR